MNYTSLKLRLLLAAALGIAISLVIAGAAFFVAFQRYAEQLAARQLENDFVQLASGIRVDAQGKIKSRAVLSDPRFERPYGGLYWQIDETGQQPVRSRSLFDVDLPDVTKPDTKVEVIVGPNNQPLFALQRELVLPTESGQERHLQITMAVERKDIDDAAQGFKHDLNLGLALLSLALLAGSLAQILLGLRPLQNLESAVKSIHGGEAKRLSGRYPAEVQSLVQNLNELLDARDTALDKARQRASNMAHGLKTPLTILGTIADDLSASGNASAAHAIRDNASLIHGQVERQLARARMASGHEQKHTALRPNVERVIKTLARTPQGELISWINAVPDDAEIAIERHDLIELLGNLADNARKWAKQRVLVSYTNQTLSIEDDGAGVDEAQLADIEKRGLRLDDATPGHGLGLSIVRELADSYGLIVKYKRSNLGGLSVSIAKPEVFTVGSTLQN